MAKNRDAFDSVKIGVQTTMFTQMTITANLIELGISLWFGFYLFTRGYPNRITARIALSLMAVSVYFLGAFNSHFYYGSGFAALRATLLLIGMGCWYSAIFALLPNERKARLYWLEYAVYALCIASIFLLLIDRTAFDDSLPTTYAAPMRKGLAYSVYGFTLIFVSFSMAGTAWINKQARNTKDSLYIFLTSSFPLFTTMYKSISEITDPQIMPRIMQDGLFFAGVFSMGIAVAKHQSMLERRTVLQEFPLTLLFVTVTVAVFGAGSFLIGLPYSAFGNLCILLITTLGLYDFTREVIDRRRSREKEEFRRKLRKVDGATGDKFQRMLQDGLNLLCETLHTSSGVVAVQAQGKARVLAARNSVEVGGELFLEVKEDEGQYRAEGGIPNIEWISSIFEGQRQIALVGIGASQDKVEFSSGDLELLDEFANHVGALVSLANLVEENQPVDENRQLDSAAEDMMQTLTGATETDLTPLVEDALRKFPDVVTLGQSPLVDIAKVDGHTQVERGKRLQEILRQAVDALRPSATRPVDVIPRAWYAYIILHDAYLEGARNRDVMARLYISEGTFNRTRRTALRGVARWVVEKFGSGRQFSGV
jgi:hypothetical protein